MLEKYNYTLTDEAVKATIEALSQMRDAKEVAFERGISMEKVFKG